MSKKYAVVENNVISNLVVADDVEVLQFVFPEATIVEETPDTGLAFVGADYNATLNRFKEPQFYASWTWEEETWAWIPPVPSPNDGKSYAWDEANNKWVEVDFAALSNVIQPMEDVVE